LFIIFLFQRRKFDQYVCDDIFTTSFELISRQKYGSENVKDERKSPSSPLSCSTSSEMCIEEYSQLSDSEDSIKGPSYPINQGGLKIQPRDLMASSRNSLSTKSSLKDKPKMKFVEGSRSFVDENFVDSKYSLSVSSTYEDLELAFPNKKFLPSRGNHLPRLVIPIGPRFQAKVPKWERVSQIKYHVL